MQTSTLQKLCDASTTRRQPMAPVHEWPLALEPESWFFSPELISLHGTPEFEALDLRAQQRLSFFEAVNFFSLNLHGERFLVEGLAARLYQPGNEVISRYLHHFLEEENNHMTWFGGFCQRYAGKVYVDKKLKIEREYETGEEDLLFFARAVVFEEIGDAFNRRMARDERLHPLAREINRRHHAEEKRHLAFGRQLVAELHARYTDEWSPAAHERIADDLAAFLRATWAEYANVAVYDDAGLDDPFALRRRAFDSSAARARRAGIESGCVRFLNDLRILR
jgi:hypothetical protein